MMVFRRAVAAPVDSGGSVDEGVEDLKAVGPVVGKKWGEKGASEAVHVDADAKDGSGLQVETKDQKLERPNAGGATCFSL